MRLIFTRFLVLLLALGLLPALGQRSLAALPYSVNVMAPLYVDNWQEFGRQAKKLKRIGVNAISVDVWWGDVEKVPGRYDWTYYNKIFGLLTAAGLKIVPIMSFHACGGNVGDTYNSAIPGWIWGQISGKRKSGILSDPENVKYKSEYGNTSNQCVSLWADSLVLPFQRRFMEAFQKHFAHLAANIQEISISGGPAGELRYPSYDAHDDWKSGYPTRGALQAYSPLAQADFRQWALAKYKGLAGVNAAWGIHLNGAEEIHLPDNGAVFYDRKEYLTKYGRDLYGWYNDRLAQHAQQVILNADQAFRGAFANIPIGVKLPGIHWQMDGTSQYQRVAEMNAGIIPASSEPDGEYNAKNAHGYSKMLGAICNAEAQLRIDRQRTAQGPRPVILHFTCLEKDDNPADGNSKAFSLASWIGD